MPTIIFQCEVRFRMDGGLWSDEAQIVLPTGKLLNIRIIADGSGSGNAESTKRAEEST